MQLTCLSCTCPHLLHLHQLRRQAVLCVAQTQLPILVPPEGVQCAAGCGDQGVRVPAGDLGDLLSFEERYRLREEVIRGVAMPQPPKISPFLWQRMVHEDFYAGGVYADRHIRIRQAGRHQAG